MFRKQHDLGFGWTVTVLVVDNQEEMYVANRDKGESIFLNAQSVDTLRNILAKAKSKVEAK